ncbi:hypothetical protein PR048_013157 [Dryococelus australis]|uniref:ISXO2-like transposase domain-containing protein n=1 Tax=Dryococelus australis TaxID=614101 RepID=A0ABQ9HSW1_9NEOP|nr:hypothetical protein PR048_013157 [Dryococelus australis]
MLEHEEIESKMVDAEVFIEHEEIVSKMVGVKIHVVLHQLKLGFDCNFTSVRGKGGRLSGSVRFGGEHLGRTWEPPSGHFGYGGRMQPVESFFNGSQGDVTVAPCKYTPSHKMSRECLHPFRSTINPRLQVDQCTGCSVMLLNAHSVFGRSQEKMVNYFANHSILAPAIYLCSTGAEDAIQTESSAIINCQIGQALFSINPSCRRKNPQVNFTMVLVEEPTSACNDGRNSMPCQDHCRVVDFLQRSVHQLVIISSTAQAWKNRKGCKVEGQWVLGRVQRHGPSKFFLVRVSRRNASTLTKVIREWVRPGTTIISDCWRGYKSLDAYGYRHLQINHTKEFVCSEMGGVVHRRNIDRLAGEEMSVHTQTIERNLCSVKFNMPCFGRRKQFWEEYLAEFDLVLVDVPCSLGSSVLVDVACSLGSNVFVDVPCTLRSSVPFVLVESRSSHDPLRVSLNSPLRLHSLWKKIQACISSAVEACIHPVYSPTSMTDEVTRSHRFWNVCVCVNCWWFHLVLRPRTHIPELLRAFSSRTTLVLNRYCFKFIELQSSQKFYDEVHLGWKTELPVGYVALLLPHPDIREHVLMNTAIFANGDDSSKTDLQNVNVGLDMVTEEKTIFTNDKKRGIRDSEKARQDAENARRDAIALSHRIADIAQDVIAKSKSDQLLRALTVHMLEEEKKEIVFTRCQR